MNFQLRRHRSHDIGDLYKHNMSLNRVFIATDVCRHVIMVRLLKFLFLNAHIDWFVWKHKNEFSHCSQELTALIRFIRLNFVFNPNHFIWNVVKCIFFKTYGYNITLLQSNIVFFIFYIYYPIVFIPVYYLFCELYVKYFNFDKIMDQAFCFVYTYFFFLLCEIKYNILPSI